MKENWLQVSGMRASMTVSVKEEGCVTLHVRLRFTPTWSPADLSLTHVLAEAHPSIVLY